VRRTLDALTLSSPALHVDNSNAKTEGRGAPVVALPNFCKRVTRIPASSAPAKLAHLIASGIAKSGAVQSTQPLRPSLKKRLSFKSSFRA
jgi:hypothetical protein